MTGSKKMTCAHDGCACELSEDCTVNRDGYCYCSEACADGAGCDHEACACASATEAREAENNGPDHRSGNPGLTPKRGDPTKPPAARNPGHNVAFNPAQGGPSIRRNPAAGKK